ncbi:hypothetical protein FBEOM_10401 [Fusarium beomiforme]|uniref:F-box domain-containing protein n=1 Tax=Fusarium beomiforme TaxID=44412 RepID=A0A9P5DUC4_9HYPO|nr:hypothetical protein FBEOM_10401 [Fusarium beomiforme]
MPSLTKKPSGFRSKVKQIFKPMTSRSPKDSNPEDTSTSTSAFVVTHYLADGIRGGIGQNTITEPPQAADCDCSTRDGPLALQDLPAEVFIDIMLCLPHSSLYLFQQTCQKFRQLTKRDIFKKFNLESWDDPESYCIGEDGYQKRKVLLDILARKTLRNECDAYRDSGKLHAVMKKLYQTRYCHGYQFDHLNLLFSPEEKK